MFAAMMLGAHTSMAGGLHTAVTRSQTFGGTALQIFSKNNNRWAAPLLSDQAIQQWQSALADSPIPLAAVAIHDSYLINLCSPDEQTLARSIDAFLDEHHRAQQLGVRLLNFHPGAACGRDPESAIALVAENINRTHEATTGFNTISVIETTAGQGTTLGWRFQEIAAIIAQIDDQSRVGVCLDTCHVFAAGYDIRTERGYREMMEEFDALIGLERLLLFHLNDSKAALGTRVDRHEHIGKGKIGEEAFRALMSDERFANVPMVIETPKGKEMAEDIENLNLLRSFVPSALLTP
ncbi:MAG: apurinic endonuclease Apn1 [Chlorobi bacterium OLB7]|nr:MAG: apurinic endonuclease Apn1 [Chlorobi bacterium OLB7]